MFSFPLRNLIHSYSTSRPIKTNSKSRQQQHQQQLFPDHMTLPPRSFYYQNNKVSEQYPLVWHSGPSDSESIGFLILCNIIFNLTFKREEVIVSKEWIKMEIHDTLYTDELLFTKVLYCHLMFYKKNDV